MSVTSLRSSRRPEYSAEIEKLVSSATLHGSESLCKLLRYLAQHALEHPGVPLKEYQIATEVFGRPADFDPHLDSTIRVQAGRLRLKLAEYYGAEGINDEILVELPKGTYVLTFRSKRELRDLEPGENVQRLVAVSSAKPRLSAFRSARRFLTPACRCGPDTNVLARFCHRPGRTLGGLQQRRFHRASGDGNALFRCVARCPRQDPRPLHRRRLGFGYPRAGSCIQPVAT